MWDIKIIGGWVIDGTGNPPCRADVAIQQDVIAAVGEVGETPAKEVLDASYLAALHSSWGGAVVCPGFVDVHSHSDAFLLVAPEVPSKIFQGVTTEVVGNCGTSSAPMTGRRRLPSDWESKPYPGPWRSMAEYRALLRQVRPAVNVWPLVGHGALRAAVMGYENRRPSIGELRAMERLLEEALDEGGHGLTTGLIYAPGCFAEPQEIEVLAAVVARRGGIYASHLRSEKDRLLESLREMIESVRRTGVRGQISHLKTAGRRQWNKVDEVLELLRTARKEGVQVAADCYPYTASWTSLDVLLPIWVRDGGNEAAHTRLRDRAMRERIRREILAADRHDLADAVMVAAVKEEELRPCTGKHLGEIARAWGRRPVDALLEILEKDRLNTQAFFFSMCEDNMRKILAESYVMVGSDASARTFEGPLAKDFPHPRAFGTFPRTLRMALDGQTVPVHEAIRKMTSLPAEHFGIRDRGILAVGKKADVVVFDPAVVCDRATYAEPRLAPLGIRHVVVNGVITVKDGQLTGSRGGEVL